MAETYLNTGKNAGSDKSRWGKRWVLAVLPRTGANSFEPEAKVKGS
jgi:hypothetical protein